MLNSSITVHHKSFTSFRSDIGLFRNKEKVSALALFVWSRSAKFEKSLVYIELTQFENIKCAGYFRIWKVQFTISKWWRILQFVHSNRLFFSFFNTFDTRNQIFFQIFVCNFINFFFSFWQNFNVQQSLIQKVMASNKQLVLKDKKLWKYWQLNVGAFTAWKTEVHKTICRGSVFIYLSNVMIL